MKVIKSLFIVFSLLSLISTAFAAEDPVVIKSVEFKAIQKQNITYSSGEWIRAEIILLGIKNPDEKASNDKFIRDIDVTLTALYRDEKAKDKKSPDSLIAFKAKARLFGITLNEQTAVVFYLPYEVREIYRIKEKPFAYAVELSVGGTPIELNKNNYEVMLSKNIRKGKDVKKNYENYQKLVSKASAANENAFMNLSQAPYNVQKFEYSTNPSSCKYIPTYIQTK